jgi:hypothetical protein
MVGIIIEEEGRGRVRRGENMNMKRAEWSKYERKSKRGKGGQCEKEAEVKRYTS